MGQVIGGVLEEEGALAGSGVGIGVGTIKVGMRETRRYTTNTTKRKWRRKKREVTRTRLTRRPSLKEEYRDCLR